MQDVRQRKMAPGLLLGDESELNRCGAPSAPICRATAAGKGQHHCQTAAILASSADPARSPPSSAPNCGA